MNAIDLMAIAENLKRILDEIPEKTRLVAVSKTRNNDEILEAYHSGHRLFGENRVPELTEKAEALPTDIEWHFIGHLQTNKVKYIAPFVSCIHSVDSFKLLVEINKRAKSNDRVIDCLLQFHIAEEESKFGLTTDNLDFLTSEKWRTLHNVRVCGVMGMATFTDDHGVVRQEFKTLKRIFDTLKSDYFTSDSEFCEISMGMSDDYTIAIEEGSTIVRVGSGIFGPRPTP